MYTVSGGLLWHNNKKSRSAERCSLLLVQAILVWDDERVYPRNYIVDAAVIILFRVSRKRDLNVNEKTLSS